MVKVQTVGVADQYECLCLHDLGHYMSLGAMTLGVGREAFLLDLVQVAALDKGHGSVDPLPSLGEGGLQ